RGAQSLGVENVSRQRMVRGSLTDAVTGAPGLITVASSRPSAAADWSVTRAARPTPATIIAQTSATATTLRWVARSAVSSEKLFMTSPQDHPVFGRGKTMGGSKHSVKSDAARRLA